MYKDVAEVLEGAFLWAESRQGMDFWLAVWEAFNALDDLDVIGDFILRAANTYSWDDDITTEYKGQPVFTDLFNHPEGAHHWWYVSFVSAFRYPEKFDRYIDDMIQELSEGVWL
jgi:hypothetical protein